MSHLVPCPGCARHVRHSEVACPFCSVALSLGDVPSPVLPQGRLGRAATFAFGASLVGATTLLGCSGSSEGGEQGGAGQSTGGSGSAMPVYGAPAAGMAGQQSGGSVNGGAGGAGIAGGGLVYGAPPAGMDAGGNAGSGGDAASGGDGNEAGSGGDDSGDAGGPNIGPVYGAPP